MSLESIGRVLTVVTHSADDVARRGTHTADELVDVAVRAQHTAIDTKIPKAAVSDALDGIKDGIGDIRDKLPDVKLPPMTAIHEDPDFVAVHLTAAFDGVVPTADDALKLERKFGYNPFKGVPDIGGGSGKSALERMRGTVGQVWDGLWLKFEDATFKMRLDGAINKQSEAIEGMTRAIQHYERTILEGNDLIKATEKSIDEFNKLLVKARQDGDTDMVNRLLAKIEQKETQLAARKEMVGELEKAKNALGAEQKLLRLKHAEDIENAERLKSQHDLNKSLSGLDENLRQALDRMTNLQSDVSRIEGRTAQETQKALRAAKQLADSGGIGG